MTRTFLTAALVCGLATTLTSGSLLAHGGHGGGGGGGHSGGGGGHAGGGGAGHTGGGHTGGGGGAPAHIGGAPMHTGGNTVHAGGNAVHVGNPQVGNHAVISGSPQVGHHPGFQSGIQSNSFQHQNFQANGSNGQHHNPGGVGTQHHPVPGGTFNNQHIGNHNIHNGNNNFQHNGNNNFHNGNNNFQHNGNNNFNHQHFVGNTVNVGNRNINIGPAGYRPAYYNHMGHYHGYWNGNWGGYGPGYGGYGWGNGYRYGGYGYRPLFWGLGGWGLGSLVYGSGYMGYYNPYYVGGVSNYGYNYAQPIPVSYSSQIVGTDPNALTTNPSTDTLNSAIAAFQQNNYDAALDITNRGINQSPNDSVLHEFRALVLFAKGDYQQAAGTIHSVLAVGPGWDWTTLSGMYADIGLYTAQLRNLEAVVKQNPQDGATRFLLAYHYMSDGFPDAAAKQLQQVVAIVPNDAVAANLLKMVSSPQGTQSPDTTAQPTPQPPVDIPAPSQSTAAPIDPATIIGDWKSSRDDGSSFGLKLTGDKTFTWSFTPKQQPAQTFSGNYSLEGNVIALEREGGGSLVAEITPSAGSGFNFRLVGAPKEDPGLSFVR